MIEVKVKLVGLDPRGEQRVVVLEENDGDRYFTMSISAAEALAISAHLKTPSHQHEPLVHDLLLTILTGAGGSIQQVILDEAINQRFSATLELKYFNDVTSLPARPVDAIALAVRGDAPIMVTDRVASLHMRRLPRYPRSPDHPPSVG